MSKRIYVVRSIISGIPVRLIEAGSKSAALCYAVNTTMVSELASQRDLVELIGEGVAVELVDDGQENSGV